MEDRERDFLREHVDPIVARMIDQADAWDAYHCSLEIPGVLLDELTWMAHGGDLYVTWSELGDVFEISGTPIRKAHRALVEAGKLWLQ